MHTSRLAEGDEMTMPQERDDERERERPARDAGPVSPPVEATGRRPEGISYSTRTTRRRAWHTVPALVLLLVILAGVAALLVVELR